MSLENTELRYVPSLFQRHTAEKEESKYLRSPNTLDAYWRGSNHREKKAGAGWGGNGQGQCHLLNIFFLVSVPM